MTSLPRKRSRPSPALAERSEAGYTAASAEAWLAVHGLNPRDPAQARGKWRATAMTVAAAEGDLRMCAHLLGRGFAPLVRAPEKGGQTPLTKACRGGHLEVARWLVAHGASGDCGAADTQGSLPIHEACREGHVGVVQWLVEGATCGGEQLRARDGRGRTPLHVASSGGHLALCQWLVLKGALNGHEGGGGGGGTSGGGRGGGGTSDGAGGDGRTGESEHVVLSEVRVQLPELRWALLRWARGCVGTHRGFTAAFLPAMHRGERRASTTTHRQEMSAAGKSTGMGGAVPRPHLALLGGLVELRRLIAGFAGVPTGRDLRTMRELAACLACVLGDDEAEDGGCTDGEPEDADKGEGG